ENMSEKGTAITSNINFEKNTVNEPLLSQDLFDSVFANFGDTSTISNMDLSLKKKPESVKSVKKDEKPTLDFRQSSSSFLYSSQGNMSEKLTEQINFESSDTTDQIPITFSSISLNLDIGDFAQEKSYQKNQEKKETKTERRSFRKDRSGDTAKSDCGYITKITLKHIKVLNEFERFMMRMDNQALMIRQRIEKNRHAAFHQHDLIEHEIKNE
ncbi:26161_t:CDS:2, partial [Racocetra persica]